MSSAANWHAAFGGLIAVAAMKCQRRMDRVKPIYPPPPQQLHCVWGIIQKKKPSQLSYRETMGNLVIPRVKNRHGRKCVHSMIASSLCTQKWSYLWFPTTMVTHKICFLCFLNCPKIICISCSIQWGLILQNLSKLWHPAQFTTKCLVYLYVSTFVKCQWNLKPYTEMQTMISYPPINPSHP